MLITVVGRLSLLWMAPLYGVDPELLKREGLAEYKHAAGNQRECIQFLSALGCGHE